MPSGGQNYRVTHRNDPVPRLPPDWIGFEHVGPEYYISSKNDVVATTGDVDILEGLDNRNGNAAWLFTDIVSHLWYLSSVTACSLDEIL